MSDYINSQERVRVLEVNREALRMRQARLEAQRDGSANLNFAQEVSMNSNDIHLAALYADEHEAFEQYSSAYRKQRERLQQQRPRIEEEIRTVESRGAIERQRLQIISTKVAEFKEVFKKGYLRRQILDDLQRDEAQAKAEVLKVDAELPRLRRELGDVEVKVGDVDATYKHQVVAELQDTRRKLREINITLGSARKLLDVRAELVSNRSDEDDNAPRYKVLVTRVGKDGAHTFRAADETMIQPGDVIDIKSLRSGMGSSSAAGRYAGGPMPLALPY